MANLTYQELLNEEFSKRKAFNASYSLRAFARDLGISAPRLSQVLNNKQGLSIKAAREIALTLNFSEEKRDTFCALVGAQHARKFSEREKFQEKIKKYKKQTNPYTELELEYFKVISDWWHFAILELTHIEDFQYDIYWMSQVLNLDELVVEQAIERLLKLGLAKEENNSLVDVFVSLNTTNDIPSGDLKKYHVQLMQKAMKAVYDQDVENREYSSTVLSINKEELPALKKHLRQFQREVCDKTDAMENKNSVYCLGIQLYELSEEL